MTYEQCSDPCDVQIIHGCYYDESASEFVFTLMSPSVTFRLVSRGPHVARVIPKDTDGMIRVCGKAVYKNGKYERIN